MLLSVIIYLFFFQGTDTLSRKKMYAINQLATVYDCKTSHIIAIIIYYACTYNIIDDLYHIGRSDPPGRGKGRLYYTCAS